MESNVSPVKVLTVGSAVGSIRDIFSKVGGINAKHGKFDLVLCIGDFFGPVQEDGTGSEEVSQLLNGEIEAPLECYVMQGEHPLPHAVIEKYASTSGQLCKNVFLLSKSGIVTTPHGLRIACLGGIYDATIYAEAESPHGFSSPYFTKHTIDKLNSNAMSKSTSTANFTSLSSIKASAASSHLIDVLISNVWPHPITQFSSIPLPSQELSSIEVPPVGELVQRTKPRYHIAATRGQPLFWEREPFIWDDEQGRISRFISLGAFGGKPIPGKKQRWFYAFSISPVTEISPPPPRPNNTTKNPFTEFVPRAQKRPLETSDGENFRWGNQSMPAKKIRTGDPSKPPQGYQCRICKSSAHFINDCPDRTKPQDGYICRICNMPGHFVRDCPTKHAVGDTGGKKPREGYVCRACASTEHYIDDCPVAQQGRQPYSRKKTEREIAPDECWFCLSNPALAKHLIVSIGTECYVTLSKGQITATQNAVDHPNKTSIPGGGHVLIVPIAHYPTLASITPDLASSVISEVERYKSALHALFARYGSAMVTFEVARLSAKGGHAHVQVIPIPVGLENKVEQAFINQGKQYGIEFESDANGALEACADGKRGYFRVDLPDGKKMVYLMKDSTPFNLQFGRQVLVSLLDMPERMDWKACVQSDDDDKLDAQLFKKAFKPFDPSL